MQYKTIKHASDDIVKILSGGVLLWKSRLIELTTEIYRFRLSNQFAARIKVPTYKRGFARIKLNYGWIYDNGGTNINFVLSDGRSFGWSCGSRHFPRKEGTDDGVSGSPTGEIEVHNVDMPINNIKLDIMFSDRIAESDFRNIGVSAKFYIEE